MLEGRDGRLPEAGSQTAVGEGQVCPARVWSAEALGCSSSSCAPPRQGCHWVSWFEGGVKLRRSGEPFLSMRNGSTSWLQLPGGDNIDASYWLHGDGPIYLGPINASHRNSGNTASVCQSCRTADFRLGS